MPPATAPLTDTGVNGARADHLRSLMYADQEFMRNIREGYEEELRGEGIPAEEYFRRRGIV